jgi:hypothetical protein
MSLCRDSWHKTKGGDLLAVLPQSFVLSPGEGRSNADSALQGLRRLQQVDGPQHRFGGLLSGGTSEVGGRWQREEDTFPGIMAR